MRLERPVLTARWTELLVLNFRVPHELLARLAPPGTEPDLYDGQAYISIVGFRFHGSRLFGLPIPGHTRFEEINLRYYVRRFIDGRPRRGVVFVKEIAPRRAIGLTANWLYNENYITRPMRANIQIANTRLALGDTIKYAWRTKTFPLPYKERQEEASSTNPLPFREGPGEGTFTPADAKFGGRRAVWAMWTGIASLLLLVTGLWNYVQMIKMHERLASTYHMIAGLKMLTGLALFVLAAMLSGRSSAAEKIRQNLRFWINVCLILGIITVVFGSVLRTFPRTPKVDAPNGQQLIAPADPASN